MTISPSFFQLSAALLLLSSRGSAQSAECNEASIQACQTYNRVCINHFVDSRDCGYCLEGYIEVNSVCYSIEAFQTDTMDDLFTYLLDEYLPDFAWNVTREERLERFIVMAQIISEHNLKNESDFELGINSEAFFTSEERSKRLGVRSDLSYDSSNGPRGDFGRFQRDGRALRDANGRQLQQTAVDWHERGYTTRVKNQGLCGCCWAVSTAAAIESALLITNQTRITETDADSVSFQQMIACDEQNLGCDGGKILYAVRYAWENDDFSNGNMGGLTSYQDYPYEDFFGVQSTCQAEGKTPKVYLNYPKVVTSVNDRSSFEQRRDLVIAAVSQQPITTTMKSQCDLISLYTRGVLTADTGCECCEASCIDHAAVIVGFDTTADVPYWKVRNSWGPSWGEAGHFRVAMDDPGCGWGLFGILAESALMEDAYTTLEEVPERPSWWETAKGYQKALIIAGGLLGFISLASCVVGGWRNYNYNKKRQMSNTQYRSQEDAQIKEHILANEKYAGSSTDVNGVEKNEVEVTM